MAGELYDPDVRLVGTAPEDWTDADLAVLDRFMGGRLSLRVAANNYPEGGTRIESE